MSRSEAAKKAWLSRRAKAGPSQGPTKIASAKSGAASASKAVMVNGIAGQDFRTQSGRIFQSRFAARSAKAIPAMLAEVKRRGFKEHLLVNAGTHYAVYFNPQGKRRS